MAMVRREHKKKDFPIGREDNDELPLNSLFSIWQHFTVQQNRSSFEPLYRRSVTIARKVDIFSYTRRESSQFFLQFFYSIISMIFFVLSFINPLNFETIQLGIIFYDGTNVLIPCRQVKNSWMEWKWLTFTESRLVSECTFSCASNNSRLSFLNSWACFSSAELYRLLAVDTKDTEEPWTVQNKSKGLISKIIKKLLSRV